jgi:hypothetical protein
MLAILSAQIAPWKVEPLFILLFVSRVLVLKGVCERHRAIEASLAGHANIN